MKHGRTCWHLRDIFADPTHLRLKSAAFAAREERSFRVARPASRETLIALGLGGTGDHSNTYVRAVPALFTKLRLCDGRDP